MEIPYVFKTIKINLNISLKYILLGNSLRVVDIMVCRRFLLTNFRSELMDHFESGKEVAIYSSVEEAVDLEDFYLRNETQRIKIAEVGYKIVKKSFTYADRIEKIFRYSEVIF